jgi:LacI family transcriptional regulator, repressor for deo operon, udp, cdd, tsx, nupC, and nupG
MFSYPSLPAEIPRAITSRSIPASSNACMSRTRCTGRSNAYKAQNGVWQLRTDGFRDAVRSAGFDVHDDMVLSPGDCLAPDGEQGASMLLESGRPLPTAIFCHTDEMAYGAMATFRRAGIRCPDDISVAGFDDHPMSYLWGLTTVTHANRQGVRAATALLGALNDTEDTGNGETSDLTVELITRETTREP